MICSENCLIIYFKIVLASIDSKTSGFLFAVIGSGDGLNQINLILAEY